MKRINFFVTDFLSQQIEESMFKLGIDSKSEFFRVLALNCAREINQRAAPAPSTSPLNLDDSSLSHEDKIILSHLQKGPSTINQLVEETHFKVPTITACLVQLLLKNQVFEQGNCWRIL